MKGLFKKIFAVIILYSIGLNQGIYSVYAEIGNPDIRDVYSDVIFYNKKINLGLFDSKFNEDLNTDPNIEYVKSGFELQQEFADREIDRYLKQQLSKINNTADKTTLNLNSNYVNLIGDIEADGNNKGIFVAIGLGKGETIKVQDSYYYLFPFQNTGNERAKLFVQGELKKKIDENNEKDFLGLLSKYGIKYMKIEPELRNVELQIGPKYGIKQGFKTNMFSSAYFNVSDSAIANKLKSKYKLFYFGYVRYDEMTSNFGDDYQIKTRGNDLFISFLDGYYSLGIMSQNKWSYETNIVRNNYFYVIEYVYNIYMRYIMYVSLIFGLIFGYLKAMSFKNRQKTLLSMSPDRI